MFAITEEHYNEFALKNNIRRLSSIKIDALMKSVHNTFHHADMTDDIAFLSSEILSLEFCTSVESV
jgi:hypothetical protein